MENEKIFIEGENIDSAALTQFTKICGFDKGRERDIARLKDGVNVRDTIKESLKLRAVVSSFGKEVVMGNNLNIDGIKIQCTALEQISKQSILGVYAFILTAGKVELLSSSEIDVFYADTWGTAYVNAGMNILRNILKENVIRENEALLLGWEGKVFVSDSIGPGFYGMELTELANIFRILNADEIGVRLSDSGMMLPVKSCTGFFIIVDDKEQLPGLDCASCSNNQKGCHFCRIKLNT